MSVYFAQPTDGGQIKIGSTADIENRMATLGSWHPPHVEVIHHIPGARVREHVLHRLLAPHRRLGEWFCSSPTVWRLVLDAIDTGLVWLPDEPQKNNTPEYGLALVSELTQRFGSRAALVKASGLSVQSLQTAQRGFGAPFGLLSTALIADMEAAGSIPAYLQWPGILAEARS